MDIGDRQKLLDWMQARVALFDAIAPVDGNAMLPKMLWARVNELELLAEALGLPDPTAHSKWRHPSNG